MQCPTQAEGVLISSKNLCITVLEAQDEDGVRFLSDEGPASWLIVIPSCCGLDMVERKRALCVVCCL